MLNTVDGLKKEILRLKKERDFCILAHCYVAHEIQEIADFVGDSYALSVKAKNTPQENILMVGVEFMAETVKILSPEKNVVLAHCGAGCQMADQMDRAMIAEVKKKYPDYSVVAYINTTANLKTICDVCVTSSSAVKIVKNMETENILFIPDCNLGDFVAKQIPEKNIKLLEGGCPIHTSVKREEADKMKKAHPNALLLVHPEALPEVIELADYVGSTTEIMEFAKKTESKEFIIGTELQIVENLQFECPDKIFYGLSKKLQCPDMRLATLPDVYNAVLGRGGKLIDLPEDIIKQARHCIDEMIRLGG
ncbi:MAG: quinolinate synthase NadA [Candidatus Fimenecus sp.]